MTQLTVEDIAKLEDEPTKTEILKPSKELVAQILYIVAHLKKTYPHIEDDVIIYKATLEYFKQANLGIHPKDEIPTLYVFYIEVFKSFQQLFFDDSALDQTLYTEATLCIFNIYLKCSDEIMARRLLVFACEALHEIITEQVARSADIKQTILNHLSTVALISYSVKEYIKGRRRPQNFPYIAWLLSFFKQAMMSNDLDFMTNNEALRDVNKQLAKRAKVIHIG